MGTVSFSLTFEEDEQLLYTWISQLHEKQIKSLLRCLFITFNDSLDTDSKSALNTVLSQMQNMLNDDQRRMLPAETALESCRLKERESTREQYEQKMNEMRRLYQESIEALREDIATSKAMKMVAEQEKASIQENIDTLVSNRIAESVQEISIRNAELEKQLIRVEAAAEVAVCKKEAEMKEKYTEWSQSELEKTNRVTFPAIAQLEGVLTKEACLLGDVKDEVVSVRNSLTALEVYVQEPLSKMQRYVDKYDNGNNSIKGRLMEDKFFVMMTRALPEYEVMLSRDNSHDMDIHICKDGLVRPKILADIKNYNQNVSSKEIRKFHSDIVTNGASGMLISAGSGIATKRHMQIDIIEGKYAAIYLVNVGSDIDNIVNALSALHSIDRFLANQDSTISIDQQTLDKVSEDLKSMMLVVNELKENNEKQRRLIMKLQFDSVLQILNGGSIQKRKNESVSMSESSNDIGGVVLFAEKHIIQSSDDFFTLKAASEAWEASDAMKVYQCPNSSVLKSGLEKLLGTTSLKQKSYFGIPKYGVFVGFRLVISVNNPDVVETAICI